MLGLAANQKTPNKQMNSRELRAEKGYLLIQPGQPQEEAK
jgi:hypothetical protein